MKNAPGSAPGASRAQVQISANSGESFFHLISALLLYLTFENDRVPLLVSVWVARSATPVSDRAIAVRRGSLDHYRDEIISVAGVQYDCKLSRRIADSLGRRWTAQRNGQLAVDRYHVRRSPCLDRVERITSPQLRLGAIVKKQPCRPPEPSISTVSNFVESSTK